MPEGSAVLADPFETRAGELRVKEELFGDARAVTNRRGQQIIREAFSSVESDLRLSPMVERYAGLLARIDKLRSLPDNWDSYGAPTPAPFTRRYADTAVRHTFELRCLPDAIIASAEGGVALCWDRAERHAYIEFDNEGAAIYARYSGQDEPLLREFSPDDVESIENYIDDVRSFIR